MRRTIWSEQKGSSRNTRLHRMESKSGIAARRLASSVYMRWMHGLFFPTIAHHTCPSYVHTVARVSTGRCFKALTSRSPRGVCAGFPTPSIYLRRGRRGIERYNKSRARKQSPKTSFRRKKISTPKTPVAKKKKQKSPMSVATLVQTCRMTVSVWNTCTAPSPHMPTTAMRKPREAMAVCTYCVLR